MLAALRIDAAYVSNSAFLPAYGRGPGAEGRVFDSELTLINPGASPVAVRLMFLRAGQPNPRPFESRLVLGAMETRIVPSATAAMTGEESASGALRIEAAAPVIAHARLYSLAQGAGLAQSVASSFNAIPSQFAAGIGETAYVPGFVEAPGFRSRVFMVETTGTPLVFIASLLDPSGSVLARKREYLGGFEQRSFDPAAEFPDVHGQAVLRLQGLSGNGRVIAGAVRIANGTQDGTAYEMSFETAPRWRIPSGEIAAYIVAGLAIVGAVAYRRLR